MPGVMRFLLPQVMRKPIFYYLAGVISVIAVLAALWGFGLILENALDFGGGGSDYHVISTSPSPDKRYIATVYTGMGGGAAGWCSLMVTVDPATEPFTIERAKEEGKRTVFSMTCSGEVDAKWEGDRNLLISFQGPSSESGFSVYRSPVDWNREVKVRYLEK